MGRRTGRSEYSGDHAKMWIGWVAAWLDRRRSWLSYTHPDPLRPARTGLIQRRQGEGRRGRHRRGRCSRQRGARRRCAGGRPLVPTAAPGSPRRCRVRAGRRRGARRRAAVRRWRRRPSSRDAAAPRAHAETPRRLRRGVSFPAPCGRHARRPRASRDLPLAREIGVAGSWSSASPPGMGCVAGRRAPVRRWPSSHDQPPTLDATLECGYSADSLLNTHGNAQDPRAICSGHRCCYHLICRRLVGGAAQDFRRHRHLSPCCRTGATTPREEQRTASPDPKELTDTSPQSAAAGSGPRQRFRCGEALLGCCGHPDQQVATHDADTTCGRPDAHSRFPTEAGWPRCKRPLSMQRLLKLSSCQDCPFCHPHGAKKQVLLGARRVQRSRTLQAGLQAWATTKQLVINSTEAVPLRAGARRHRAAKLRRF